MLFAIMFSESKVPDNGYQVFNMCLLTEKGNTDLSYFTGTFNVAGRFPIFITNVFELMNDIDTSKPKKRLLLTTKSITASAVYA